MKKIVVGLLIVLGALAIVLLIVVRLRYGGGEYYPNLTTPPIMPELVLEEVVRFDEPIGNVAVSGAGRLFFTIHPESRPEKNRLMEWVNGEAVPYPTRSDQDFLFTSVLGLVVDRHNRLWTIDHGSHGFGGARLLAFDLMTNRVVHDHSFAGSAAPLGSFLQDLQVDAAGGTVFIADLSFWRKRPAIVVYDVETGLSRRVLERHESVVAQDWIIRTPVKDMVFFGGLAALKPGVDGIALDPAGRWLYYGAMSHDSLYRVPVSALLDPSLRPDELADRVERFSDKPLSDGLSTDTSNNVFITDVEHGAILRVGADRKLRTLVKSSRFRWADALCFGPDGWLYVADSALPDQMLRSKDHMRDAAPYFIYRFRPGTAGVPGQ